VLHYYPDMHPLAAATAVGAVAAVLLKRH
jgi:hypothetical protein